MRAQLAPGPTASLRPLPGRALRTVPAPQQGAVLGLTANENPRVLLTPTQVSCGMESYSLAAALGWCPASVWQSHVHVAFGPGAGVSPPCEGPSSALSAGEAVCDQAPLALPQTYVQFWPSQGEDDYGRFHVQLISEEPGAGFTTWTLVLSNRQQVGPLLRAGKLL